MKPARDLPSSYLVRLWFRSHGVVAEARPLASGRNRSFRSLEQLCDFLKEQVGQGEQDEDPSGMGCDAT